MKDKVIYIAFIVLGVIAVVLWLRLDSISDDRDRLSENQTSMIEGINNIILNNKEMKEFLNAKDDELLKRMSDSLGKIKVNNLHKYSSVVNNYVDSTIIEVPLVMVDNMYPFAYKDSCWGVKGFFDLNEQNITFTERSSSTKVVRVDYVRRQPVKWLFGLRIGKKKAGVYVESSCGNAETMEIEVQ